MSSCRQQVLIDAPVEAIWALVGDPRRHHEWWPRVVEVRGERFEVGDRYAQVTRGAMGAMETTLVVESRDELHELRLHCEDTGTFTNWRFTDARGRTFVDADFGIEPKSLPLRVWDGAFGRRYFRSWMAQSVEALARAAKGGAGPQAEPQQ